MTAAVSDGPPIETTNVHHAMWVMSTETCCSRPFLVGTEPDCRFVGVTTTSLTSTPS